MNRPSLPATLASIALQDAEAVEVVLVNALGSGHPHPSPTVGAHAVRWVDTGRPLRRSAAANAGLDAAAGEHIIFLDDDDVFLVGHLSRLHEALRSSTEAVAAYADVEFGHDSHEGWVAGHVFAAEFDALRLRFENFLPLHAVMVRRGGVARECRFDETLDLFEDWDWWLQLSRLGNFIHVPGVSARYRDSSAGGSGVFADNAATASARQQLLTKWLQRDTAGERLHLLQALQTEYRAARQSAEQLALAQRTELDLRAMLQHREREIAEAVTQIDALKTVVEARQREIADAGAQMSELRAVLTSRERELADAITQIDALKLVLAAREREIADLQRLAADLQAIVAARDGEIVNLRAALGHSPRP